LLAECNKLVVVAFQQGHDIRAANVFLPVLRIECILALLQQNARVSSSSIRTSHTVAFHKN